jgi:hypothetical protein
MLPPWFAVQSGAGDRLITSLCSSTNSITSQRSNNMPGPHTYTMDRNAPNDLFGEQLHAKLNGTQLDQDNMENWSPEKVRKFEEQRLKEIATRNDGFRSRQDVAAFHVLHPEYRDDVEANTVLMNHELKRMGVPINPTIEQLETAYYSLRASGVLTLNQAVVAKQEKEAAKERAAAHRNSEPTLEELYSMPMEDLRRLGNS